MTRLVRNVIIHLRRLFSLWVSADAPPGSHHWLVRTEIRYGGIVTGVRRDRVSPHDPRTEAEIVRGGMTGGDRMLHHGYAKRYAEFLRPCVAAATSVTLVEIGILRGSGLAMWCDLFPTGRIIGLDVDLGHVTSNMPALRAMGAFTKNEPELHEFDQFLDNREYLGAILRGDVVDVCIDDGFHSTESIMTTMHSILPHMAQRFVYFIEDNPTVHREIRSQFPELDIVSAGDMTIVSRAWSS
jgi:hypothetical protein